MTNPPRFPARLLRRVGQTEPGTRLYAALLMHLDRASYRLSGGRMLISATLSGLPIGLLHTVGARSGQPRTVPLIFVPDPDNPAVLAVIGSNYGRPRLPAWVHNLRATPRAAVTIGATHRPVTAVEVSAAAYDRWWSQAVATYAAYDAYRRRLNGARPIPMFELTPHE